MSFGREHGAQVHEIVIAALAPGKTLQDFVAWKKG